MDDSRHLSIGEFASLTGLTARALRLYAEAGVLPPTDVDPDTGYRSYDRSQLEGAERVRLLRAAGVAIADVATILASPPATQLLHLDAHLSTIDAAHEQARSAIRLVRARLAPSQPGDSVSTTTIPSELLAKAIDAASRCCAADTASELNPLAGVRCRVDGEGLHFASSDKYSAAFVDVACEWSPEARAERLLAPGFLAGASDTWPASVRVELSQDGFVVDGDPVPTLDQPFPDIDRYVKYLSRLDAGCIVSTDLLLAALPESDGADDAEPAVELALTATDELVITKRGRDISRPESGEPIRIPATTNGRGRAKTGTALVSPFRLRAILTGLGDRVVLALARSEPIAIGDVADPSTRFLLMPMVPAAEEPAASR